MLPKTSGLTVDPADSPPPSAGGPESDGMRSREELRMLEAGLDRLQTAADVSHRRRGVIAAVVPPLVLVTVLLLAWHAYTLWAQPRPDLFPGPVQVLGAFGEAWRTGRMQEAVGTSLERGIVGFAIALAIGTPLGLVLSEWRLLRRAAGPLIAGLQVLPSVAWVPAAIIWFGLSDATVFFVILMGATPSVIGGLLAGLDQVPPQLRRVGTVLGASRWQQAWFVTLPAALPGYLAGIRQGWAFSWRSLMAAEIIAVGGSIGFGLGSLLQQSRELADLAGVLMTIMLILTVGVLIELLLFGPVERRILRRRGLTIGGSR